MQTTITSSIRGKLSLISKSHLTLKALSLAMIMAFFVFGQITAQSSNLSDYVIIAGETNCSNATNCGVFIGPNVNFNSGNIASYSGINTQGNLTFSGDLYSQTSIVMGGGNQITGDIYGANILSASGNIIDAGSGSIFGGNVIGNGDILINGGSVAGQVIHPTGSVYSGPVPDQGEQLADYDFNSMPAFPVINTFPVAGNGKISNSQTVSPGSYGSLALKGGKTFTFSGPGDYVFKEINNKGSYNIFRFDFQNDTSGVIRILVHDDVELGKVSVEIINGGDPGRIYTEVHGNGASSSSGTTAWHVSPGSVGSGQSSQWYGTVWAPYGSVEVGGGSDKAIMYGSIFSTKAVIVNNNVQITHVPYSFCNSAYTVSAESPDTIKCDQPTVSLVGSTNLPGGIPQWRTVDGNIISGANTFTPTVNRSGYYYLTVSASGCTYEDSVYVIKVDCILPYYPPPNSGKTYELIGSELNSLLANNNYSDTAGHIFQITGGNVGIEVIAVEGQYQNLLNLLQTAPYGLTNVIDNGPASLVISGNYPIQNLGKLDSLPQLINHVRPLFPPLVKSGIALSQGDAVMHAPFARGGFDVAGEGTKIGVLSNSYNTIPGDPAHIDVINEDLPGVGNSKNPHPVSVIAEYPYGIQSDEGRAMLQIIHDVAPQAKLAFATGFLSAGNMAKRIYDLVADSCDILVDDITYITEPFLADGTVAQAVDSVASMGVAYFSSAGNFGDKAYGSTFNPVPAPAGILGEAHDFGGGDVFQSVTLAPGNYTIVLQWQDSIYSIGQTSTGTNNDLDIYLTDDFGNTLFGFNRNNLQKDPIEVLPFTVTQNTQSNILIIRAAGTDNVPFKYIVYRGNITINEYNSNSSTIAGHPNAEGAMAVGAVLYSNTPDYGIAPTVASFSSRGGTPVGGIVRDKPDFCAPNGVNTTVNLGGVNIDNDIFPNFFGTSAAAPHAAAVAALIKSAQAKFENQNASPAEIKSILSNSAIDMHSSGLDYLSGAGFIQADQALLSFANPKPTVNQIALVDTSLTPGEDTVQIMIEGDYFTSSTVILMRDDTLSTSYADPSAMTATVPPFNGNPPIRAYNAPITSSLLDGGYSDTLLFYAPVKQLIQVIANSASKRYSEMVPPLTFTVLVDSVSYDSAGFTLADMGLDSATVYTTATSTSNVGLYLVRAEMPPLDPSDPFDIGLTEIFNYEFIDAQLSVTPMPLVISANDTTIEYGEPLGDFHFEYSFPDSLVNPVELTTITDSIIINHQSNLANALALVNRIASGRALVNADLFQLSFAASGRALVNASRIASGRALVNGSYEYDTTYIVAIADSSIFEYQESPDSTTVINAYPLINGYGRALVNALSYASGRALVNGYPLINAYPLINGYPLINAYPLINGEHTESDSSEVVLILDAQDVDTTTADSAITFSPINMITGINVGVHAIVPGAFFNQNYAVSYQLGNLTITPSTLHLAADSVSSIYGDSALFNYTTSGYRYDDTESNVISGPPTYTVLDSLGSPISDLRVDAGGYVIMPDSLELSEPSNYTVSYSNGWLDVSPASLEVKAPDTTLATYGQSVSIIYDILGFRYDDDTSNIVSGPTTEILDTAGTPYVNPILESGLYVIHPDNLVLDKPWNYTTSYTNGMLDIDKASLTITAEDTSRPYGTANPSFTLSYSGFVYADSESDITPPSASTTANASSPVGLYPINLSGGAADNYYLILQNGTLTVLPAELTCTADDHVIFRDDSLPVFTYTLTGDKNPADVITTEPTMTLNPVYNNDPGVYDIIPSNLILTNNSNYTISYVNGALYVNPKGKGAKSIKPSLDCVDTVVGHPSGFNYVAHFAYQNTNKTPVYIPHGPDNSLQASGPYFGDYPELFPPGSGSFDIYFDGSKMTWVVTTYNGNQKTSSASDASSTSNKCGSNGKKSAPAKTKEEYIEALYPNPVKDWLTLVPKDPITSKPDILYFNAAGQRIKEVPPAHINDNGEISIDMSRLRSGIYFILLENNGHQSFYKISKE